MGICHHLPWMLSLPNLQGTERSQNNSFLVEAAAVLAPPPETKEGEKTTHGMDTAGLQEQLLLTPKAAPPKRQDSSVGVSACHRPFWRDMLLRRSQGGWDEGWYRRRRENNPSLWMSIDQLKQEIHLKTACGRKISATL